MQIRKRGMRLEFLRSTYDTEAKRSRQKLIGSTHDWSLALPTELREKMTEEEIAEAEAYFDKTKTEQAERQKERAVAGARIDLSSLAKSIDDQDVTAEQAEAIFAGLDKVKKALRKQGFTAGQFKKTEPKPEPKDPKQLSMEIPFG